MKRILVTGGAGFIGSHLCTRLIAVSYTHLDVYKRQMPEGSTFAEKYDVHEALNRF